ncbi:PEP/pyruvate-binding domain-containing protein [Nocardia sp. NPDC050406]|uniref:PEP/pyruvate-binding domain-containing protein n=1 Tax=Nocardia sp. NPDC050406 TaxID=3364318 RepID=UPI0037904107
MTDTGAQEDLLVLELHDPAATLERAGGKGASLARMAGAGLPVPPGFHVTTAAYRRFAAANGLRERLLAQTANVSADEPATWEDAAAKIGALLADQPVPEEIDAAIAAAYARMGEDVPVAVRSSATAEDLPDMSFAGQQETYLDIRGRAAVADAVRRCWASLWTARAIGYRARQGIASEDVELAVVVQELVPAEAAGIAFTADPVTGARDRIVINAAWGLGEAIVGGQVTPDTFVVSKADQAVVSREIGDKRVMTVRTGAGTEERDVPADQRTRPALESRQAAELARVAVRIEEFYQQPMDIEWALHDDRIFIVQARPITALPEPKAPAPQWELPDPHGKYVRGSVMELLPNPLSPLFETLGIPAWSKATVEYYHRIHLPYFDDPLAVINGYGYYNVDYTPGLLARMAVAQPRFLAVTLPRRLRAAPEIWHAAHTRYQELAARWGALDPEAESASTLLTGVRELVAEAAEYYLAIQGGILPAAYFSESAFTKAYNAIRRDDDPPALDFLLGFDSKPVRAEQSLYDLARWVRTQPGLADRVAEAETAELTGPPEGDAAWREFRDRFAEHLRTFGDMVYDLDFAAAVPMEDPGAPLRTLAYFLTEDAANPHARQRTAERKRAAAEGALDRRGLRAGLVRPLLHWAQAMAPMREDALADVGLGWPVVRRLLRELGRRLVAADALVDAGEVYLLRLDELDAAVRALDAGRAPEDSRAMVADRRETQRQRRAVAPPHVLPVEGGTTFLGMDISRFLGAHAEETEDAIKGTPGSPGQVTAPARIIHGPEEFDQMRRGDVLVARITTPAWTPLFSLASAVVTDVGGALSHSSIVAREYHIPAVLGTGAATERLRTGQRVTVDGDAGLVTIAER